MSAPRVFISYSHDTPEHKAWVLKLATDLRLNGVDALIDQLDLNLGEDLAAFMERGILESSRVLLICSENYVKRAEKGLGGVGYERLIVTAEVVNNIGTKKFIPVIRNNTSGTKVPRFLGPRLYIDFSDDSSYLVKREELLREIHGAPALTKPPVGPNPFSGQSAKSTETAHQASSTAVTASAHETLADQWFEREASAAAKGLAAVGRKAHMELRLKLHTGVNKSQSDLLNSMRRSTINTFGWPLGLVDESDSKWRPKPYSDGIRAEIAVKENKLLPNSYDYWSLRYNGDFFLTQSLFEDGRAENKIFFDTRIVRVTEALLLALNLYTNLGAAPETQLSVRVTHRGLEHRELTSAGSNYFLPPVPRISHEGVSQAEVVVTLARIKETLAQNVIAITGPLFMLFDYTNISESIYTDIVKRFESGRI